MEESEDRMESDRRSQPDVAHNLFTRLAAVGEKRPDAPAIAFSEYGADGVISYARLLDRIGAAARLLDERGLKHGDRVILCLDNQPELIVFTFACARLGLTSLFFNNRLKQRELEPMFEQSKARCVVTNEVGAEAWGRLLERVEHAIVVQRGITPKGDGRDLKTTFRDVFAVETGAPSCTPVSALDPAFVFYTSGTTAVPKGAVITHGHARWTAERNIDLLAVGAEDATLLLAPLHHVLAFSFQLLTTLFSGGCVVLQRTVHATRFWEDALRYRCTWASMLPHILHALDAVPVPETHYFKFWSFGCKYLPIEARYRVETVGWWGMTELFAVGSTTRRFDGAARNLSVGKAMPDYEYRLVDTRADPGPFGAVLNGDMHIKGERGATIFLEYLDRPEETQQAFTADGWFVTGDRFYQDPEQTLFFDTRVKDIIRVGDENISAAELELAVYASGMVREAAVVARKDKMLGEVPIVCAILNAEGEADRVRAEAEIRRSCRERLTEFKRPRAVMFFEEFPRAELGKVAKNRLRELVANQELPSRTQPLVPLETPMQRKLAAVWANVLDVDVAEIGRDDDFFSIGGSSFLLQNIQSQIAAELGVELSITDLLGFPTVRMLERRIEQLLSKKKNASDVTQQRN